MPRVADIYGLPYPDVVDGTTIESSVHNGTMNDIELDLNAPRPIVAGGTGANNAHDAMVNLSGEIANQLVTNYDSHPFVSGSFASAPGATSAPTAGAGYYGTVIVNSSSFITLEAYANGTNTKYVRVKSGTWGAWAQAPGSQADADARYVNVTGDTMTGALTVGVGEIILTGFGTDPVQGVLRFGNAGTHYLYKTATNFQFTGAPLGINDTTASTSSTTGALTVAGGVGIAGSLNVFSSGGPKLIISYTGGTNNYYDADNHYFRNVAADGKMTVDNTTVAVHTSTASTSSTTGALTVAGGVGIVKELNVGGITKVTATTVSSSVTTGALTVAGGAGIAGALYTGTEMVMNSGGSNGIIRFGAVANGKYIYYNGATFDVTAEITCSTYITSTGYACRAGISGALSGNMFNINYAAAAFMYIGTTNLGQIAYTSDYRIKKDVVDLPSTWDTVKALRPIKYTQAQFNPPSQVAFAVEEIKKAKEEAEKNPDATPREINTNPLFEADNIERWGFIAHELQATLVPSAATGVKDSPDTVQSPNPWTVISALTKALQEAMVRIEALEAAA